MEKEKAVILPGGIVVVGGGPGDEDLNRLLESLLSGKQLGYPQVPLYPALGILFTKEEQEVLGGEVHQLRFERLLTGRGTLDDQQTAAKLILLSARQAQFTQPIGEDVMRAWRRGEWELHMIEDHNVPIGAEVDPATGDLIQHVDGHPETGPQTKIEQGPSPQRPSGAQNDPTFD